MMFSGFCVSVVVPEKPGLNMVWMKDKDKLRRINFGRNDVGNTPI